MVAQLLAMDCDGTITWTRNCAIAEKLDAGKPRRYNDRSGRIKYTLFFHHHAKRVNIVRCNDIRALVFQHHAKRVNIVGDNDIRTHIVVAKEDGRPQHS